MKKAISVILAVLMCLCITGCSSSKIPSIYKMITTEFINGLGSTSLEEVKSYAESNSLKFEKNKDTIYNISNGGKWDASFSFSYDDELLALSFHEVGGERSIYITQSTISYAKDEDLPKRFDTLADCEQYVFGAVSGIDYKVEKRETSSSPVTSSVVSGSSDSSKVSSGTNSTNKYEKPVIETGKTELYNDVFIPFFNGFGTMSFSDAKKIAGEFKEKGYEVKFIEPDDRTLAQVFVTAADGDVVYVQCGPDFHKEDGIDRVFLIQYEHGEYHICVSNSLFTVETRFEIGDPNTEKGFYHVDSFSECTQFMFGEATSGGESKTYTLLYGDVLDKKAISDTLIIKAKITSSYNNKATVDQNYYNIEDIIKKQGGSALTEIQYWAVADMSDGSEQKVISFTVSESVIKKIANNEIVANQIGNYVDDLFIHASLR